LQGERVSFLQILVLSPCEVEPSLLSETGREQSLHLSCLSTGKNPGESSTWNKRAAGLKHAALEACMFRRPNCITFQSQLLPPTEIQGVSRTNIRFPHNITISTLTKILFQHTNLEIKWKAPYPIKKKSQEHCSRNGSEGAQRQSREDGEKSDHSEFTLKRPKMAGGSTNSMVSNRR
jgi:hypothetical protein